MSTLTTQIASIESGTQRVQSWLLNNGLHLNPSKSEAIAFYNPRSKPLAALAESIGTVSVAGSPIKLQTSIKNLGVYLDSKMSFDKQVSETCKACYFHIRALRHIRATLTTSRTIAAATVSSRLDYCNSLLAGTSVSNLTRSVSRILLLELSHKNLGSATSHLSVRICIGFRFATELVSKLLRLLSGCSNLSSHPIFHLSFQDMYRPDHSALIRLSQYTFLHVKPPLQLPNHFHLLFQIFGIHCQSICLPFQLFLLLEELSNITYSSLLTLTVVQNLVRSNQLSVSRFVIQRQLLPSHSPEIPCRPSKGVPSERLRLVK